MKMNKKQFITILLLNIVGFIVVIWLLFVFLRYEYITETQDFGRVSFTNLYRVDRLTGEIKGIKK